MANNIVPDYIIYDELKRKRERVQEERPVLEMPKYVPMWPEGSLESPAAHEEHDDSDNERGEVIIQMW